MGCNDTKSLMTLPSNLTAHHQKICSMPRKSHGPAPTTDNKVKQAMAGLKSKCWNSVYAAAKGVGMSANTLTHCLNGGKSRVEAREEQQLLTKAEEKVLVKWITHLT